MLPVISVFIGQNHSGSWSATEAMGATLNAAQFLELEEHKFATAAGFPGLRQQLETASRLIASRPEPPRLVSSHVPLPLHIGLAGARIRYFTLLRHPGPVPGSPQIYPPASLPQNSYQVKNIITF